MTLEEARKHFAAYTESTGELFSLGWYLYYRPGDEEAVLDGDFTAEDLEALALIMRASQEAPRT